MNHIHAIDLSNWIHRAYYVAPAELSANGEPTGAAKIFINMVEALVSKVKETAGKNDKHFFVFAVDCPREKSNRYLKVARWAKKRGLDENHLYKAGRDDDPKKRASIRSQIKLVLKMLEVSGFPLFAADGAEADDVLATISFIFKDDPNIRVWLYTRDKDCAQLLKHKNTSIIMPDTGNAKQIVLSTSKDCIAKYGVPPKRIVDYLTMLGDKADNIPGIPGLGESKAAAALKQYGSLSSALEDPDFVKRFKSLREDSLVMPVKMMRNLIRLDTEVQGIPTDLEEYARKPLTDKRVERMRKLRKKYRFSSLFGA